MRKRTGLIWIPFFVDKWLFGSTRQELLPDEQSVWIDFLMLAAKDDGYIRANENTAYPVSRIAGLLGKSEELINRTIEKCLQTKPGEKPKISRDETGIIYLIGWDAYQLSDRHKRRFAVSTPEKDGEEATAHEKHKRFFKGEKGDKNE